jgi:hypothetical protein
VATRVCPNLSTVTNFGYDEKIIRNKKNMKIEFKLSKEDILQLQLFMASQSEQIIKARKKSKWRVPIVYAVLGLLLAVTTDKVFGIAFFGIGILWFFFYPGFIAKRYVKMYTKNIDENLSNRVGKSVELTFGDEYIESNDYSGESKLKIATIERIDEVRNYCFLKFDYGVGLVIPLTQLSEKESFIEYLKNMAAAHGIAYETNMEWKWK